MNTSTLLAYQKPSTLVASQNPSTLVASHCSNNRCSVSFLSLRTATHNLRRQSIQRTLSARSSTLVSVDIGGKNKLTAIQPVVQLLPPPLRLATSSILVAGVIAAAAGYGLGLRFCMTQNLALGGAAALATASAAAVYSIKSCLKYSVPEVAALHKEEKKVIISRLVPKVVKELDRILAFNSFLVSLKKHPDANRFASRIGLASLRGGYYRGDLEIDDLKLLYRVYVTDCLSNGRMEKDKLAVLDQLRDILGLGEREAEAITYDITSRVYCKRLAQSMKNGDLEMADSKEAFLQNLCAELHFDPLKASEIHEEVYRQKLEQCVAEGELLSDLSDEDAYALLKLRVMLCVPQQAVEAAHADLSRSLYEKLQF